MVLNLLNITWNCKGQCNEFNMKMVPLNFDNLRNKYYMPNLCSEDTEFP